jgi:subtilisin family serine protease
MKTLLKATILAAIALAPIARAQDRIPVTSLDDLPRHTYQIPGSASDLVQSDDQFADLAAKVRADIEADLAKYDIKDKTTLQRFQGVLMSLDMLDGDYDSALERVELLRGLEDKQSKKLMTGLSTIAFVKAAHSAGDDGQQFVQVYAKVLHDQLKDLPWDIVGDEIEQRKGRAEMFSPNLLLGIVQSRIDPVIEQTHGEISADIAQQLVGIRYALEVSLPLKDVSAEVYSSIIDAHRVEKKDIWAERDVTFKADAGLTPVVIAIWDSGLDVSLHDNDIWTNPNEKADGTDTDGNGFVDDVHGIAYDLYANRTPDLLQPIDALHTDESVMADNMKGFMDLQASVDSKEAADARKFFASLKPDQVQPFIEDVGLFGNYSHGTHVAGIAAAGNPFIRLMPARITFDYHMTPMLPTIAQAYRDAAANVETIDYFKEHGVRVVNMSWGGNRASIEDALEAHGVGETPEARAELARRIFKIGRDSLYEAMRDAPDILFVTSAGNADNDVEFDEMIPSGFDLPNLIVVGAVDQAGDPTGFTSFGRTVNVYANGFEVESDIPGGRRMKFSGTSMSSPNVVNLAAKLLAVNPDLTPAQLIKLIEDNADRVEGEHTMLLINPRKTITQAKNPG